MTRLFVLVVAAALAVAAPASAALRGPALQTPKAKATGHSVPVLTWSSVRSAHLYEVAVSADRRFGSVVTGRTLKTRNTAATLAKSIADGTYFWRVRAVSKSGKAGKWSKVRDFVKLWQDAPELTAPANELSVQWPGLPLTLRWNPVPKATKYLVTVATDPTLAQPVFKTVETQATVYAVPGALASGRYYWAVQPVDQAGFKGRRSRVGAFTWTWSNATRVTVDDVDPRAEVTEPLVRWDTVPGAAKYQVEINPTAEFATGSKVFDEQTIATSVSPRDPLPNNTYHVRVRAIDPRGNAGGWSTATALKRFVPAVTNLRVGDNVAQAVDPGTPNSMPLVAWDPVVGAAGYTLQIGPWTGSACNWSARTVFWDTPNASWTPTHTTSGMTKRPDAQWRPVEARNPFADGAQYCVRVRAFQSDKTLGDWTERKPAFRYDAPDYSGMPAATCSSLPVASGTYRTPVGGVLPRTPVFRWNAVANARGYWIVIAKDPEFTTIVETAWLSAPVYASPTLTYSDETTAYYWAVMPGQYTNGDCVTGIPQDFAPQSFHKRSNPPSLISPAPGSDAWTQPTFHWAPVEGASVYRLEVDTDPSFSKPIETVTTASTTYTTSVSYPVDSTLYWRVRAVDHRKIGLNWSSVGTFRRRLTAPGSRPNAGGGEIIPMLDWEPVAGAVAYDMHVDQSDGTSKDFTVAASAFTPTHWYGTGIWRWKVRARFPSLQGTPVHGPYGGEQSYVRRLNPPKRPRIVTKKGRLYFTWDPDAAATQYRLEVSRTDSFTQPIDAVRTPETAWAPLLTKRDYLTGGKLYWRLAVVDSGGNVGAFSLGTFKLPKALIVRVKRSLVRKGARSRLVVTITDSNKKRIRKASVTVTGAGVKRIRKRSSKKGRVTLSVRPRKRGTLVIKATRSGYREGELRLRVG